MDSSLPLNNITGNALRGTRGAPWGEPLLAALPHLWIGVLYAGMRLPEIYFPGAPGRVFSGLGTAALIVFALFCLGVAVYSLRQYLRERSWPPWSASWFFYIAWLTIVVIGYIVYSLAPDAWVLQAVLILGGLGGLAVLYLLMFRYSPQRAALAGLFLMPVATQIGLESIPDVWEALLGVAFGVLAAIAAVGIVRSQSWVQGVAVALAANLAAGLLLTYVSFYQTEIPNFYGDSFLEAALAFLMYILLAAVLFLGPAVFWLLAERFLRRLRRKGEVAHGG